MQAGAAATGRDCLYLSMLQSSPASSGSLHSLPWRLTLLSNAPFSKATVAWDEAGTWGEGLSGEGFARLTANAGIGGVLGYRLKNLVPDFRSALAASVDVVLSS